MTCKVCDFLGDWLEIRKTSVRPRTVEQYRGAIARINRAIGERSLLDLTPAACASAYAADLAAGHERTAQITHQVLKMALADAVAFGMIPASPMSAIKRPRHTVGKVEPFTHDEVARILRADPAHSYLWVLLWRSGIRRGEACALRWSDVDFARETLSINKQLVSTSNGVIESAPKSESGVRVIPIDSRCIQLLRNHLRDQVADGRAGDYVISADGRRPDPRRVNRLLLEAAAAAGVGEAHPHRFRHTYGTDGVSAGVPIRVLQALMGHSEITVTAKYYAAVRDDAMVSASNQMQAYWSDKVTSVF